MATVVIDNNCSQAQNLLNYISTLPFAKVIEDNGQTTAEDEPYDLYKSLESAFADVKLMQEGKMKEKSLDEFLEEIRIEREYELQDSHH